jgi:hypothetical protein
MIQTQIKINECLLQYARVSLLLEQFLYTPFYYT